MRRLADSQEFPFYKNMNVTKVVDDATANQKWVTKGYDPLPFPESSNVVKLKISEPTGLNNEFVRFHGEDNKVRPFILREKDIPYTVFRKLMWQNFEMILLYHLRMR
jgi:hypothetical protein